MKFSREKLIEVLGTELTDVLIKEISAVDDPAFGEAGWLLMKVARSGPELQAGLAARPESLIARVVREGSIRLT